jgi:hypothetical protein
MAYTLIQRHQLVDFIIDNSKVDINANIEQSKIQNLVADLTAINNALAGKLEKSGDTMTGFLTLNADPTNALHAVTKQYADARLLKSGDTMTGFLTLNADPTDPLHSATKQYVDANTSAVPWNGTGGVPVESYGLKMIRIANTVIQVALGYTKNSTNNYYLVVDSSPLTVNIAVNGVNGLDTGSVAINTKYCLYLIGDSNGVNPVAGIWSTNFTTPTLPLGYDIYKCIGAIVTDSSGNIPNFRVLGNGSHKTMRLLSGIQLFNGTSGSSTTISSSNYIPSIATKADLNIFAVAGQNNITYSFTLGAADDASSSQVFWQLQGGGSGAGDSPSVSFTTDVALSTSKNLTMTAGGSLVILPTVNMILRGWEWEIP